VPFPRRASYFPLHALHADLAAGTSLSGAVVIHDAAVLIGRFQPFHRGHAALLRRAFETGERVVLVLGSAHAARTPRNPFTASEREAMVRSTLTESENERLVVLGQRDVWCAERWAREVRDAVESVVSGRIALVGFRKDATSFYLESFPGWDWIDTGRQGPLDATPLRERLLGTEPLDDVLSSLRASLSPSVLEILASWDASPVRQELSEELAATRADIARWGDGPFVTVDILVRAMGRVLLIHRAKRPGHGLLAMPGGFLEDGESREQGALRVLRDETGLSLDGMFSSREMLFSHPGRSQRARIATHAFLFEPSWERLPDVFAGPGVSSVAWRSEANLAEQEDQFFEDHFHILSSFLVGLPG